MRPFFEWNRALLRKTYVRDWDGALEAPRPHAIRHGLQMLCVEILIIVKSIVALKIFLMRVQLELSATISART